MTNEENLTGSDRTEQMQERGSDLNAIGVIFYILSFVLRQMEIVWHIPALAAAFVFCIAGAGYIYKYAEKGSWRRRLNGAYFIFLILILLAGAAYFIYNY